VGGEGGDADGAHCDVMCHAALLAAWLRACLLRLTAPALTAPAVDCIFASSSSICKEWPCSSAALFPGPKADTMLLEALSYLPLPKTLQIF